MTMTCQDTPQMAGGAAWSHEAERRYLVLKEAEMSLQLQNVLWENSSLGMVRPHFGLMCWVMGLRFQPRL